MTTTSLQLRAALSHRILLAIAGAAAIAACGDDSSSGAGASGQGGSVGEGAGGAAATGGNADGGAASGGAPSQGGQGGGGATEGGGGSGGAGGEQDVERCFANPNVGVACPTISEATRIFLCTADGERVLAWDSGPTENADMCCYQVDVSAPNDPSCGAVGRPLVVDAIPRRAPIARGRGPRGSWESSSSSPRLAGLTAADRAELARAWAEEAAFEHASVASFAKFSLELMALGAPADLVARAHLAALDEIRHAGLGLGLASAYAGVALEPAPFEAASRVAIARHPEEIVAAVVVEGCVGETLAALVAAAQHAVASDPAVRGALEEIARDESSHAELAWRTVAWAIRSFGPSMKTAVSAAFDRAFASFEQSRPSSEVARHPHGRLSGEEAHAERTRGLADVVRPSMRALLA